MAAPAGASRLRGHSRRLAGAPRQLAIALGAIFAIGAAFLVVTQSSEERILLAAAAGIGLAMLVYCFLEENIGRTLVLFLLYVTLLDGYLKLATGSELIVIGRDLLLGSIVAGMLVRAIVRRDLSIPPLTGAIVLYVGLVLVQIGHPDNSGLLHSIGGLRPHLEFVPLFFVAFAYLRTARRIRILFLLLLAVTAVNGAVALMQYQLTPEELSSWGPGYRERVLGGGDVAGRTAFSESVGEARVRPFGLGSDVGFGGSLAILAAPAGFALISLRRRGGSRLLAAILGGGVVIALVTSQARITIVLAAVAALAYVALTSLSQRRLQLIAGLLIAGAVSWIALSIVSERTDSTVFDRYESIAPNQLVGTALDYKSATFALTREYLSDIPFGTGLGTVGPASNFAGLPLRTLDGESQFNFLIVELGIPGLAFMVLFVGGLLVLGFARIPGMLDDQVRPLLAAMGAATIAILFGFSGAPVTAGVPLGPFLWITAGTFAYWLIHLPRVRRQAELLDHFQSR